MADKSPPETQINLAANLDGGGAGELALTLEPLVQPGARVIAGGDGVERIGTQAVQVLLAAGRSLRTVEGQLVLVAPSAPLIAAFSDLGLEDEIKAWSAA